MISSKTPKKIKYCRYLSNAVKVDCYDLLLESINWKREKVTMMGKVHKPYRYYALFSDLDTEYNYAGGKRKTTKTTKLIRKLISFAEGLSNRIINIKYNVVLVIYYPDGNSSLGYHSDYERNHTPNAPICSLSFGADRDLLVKEGKNKANSITLSDGDFFIMLPGFQQKYKHSVPERKNIESGRIVLTFRSFDESS